MIAEPDNEDRAPIVPFEEVLADEEVGEPELETAGSEKRGGFWGRLFGRGK